MSRVQSAMGRLRALAVELVAELADELPLGPGQPLVVERDGQHALFPPAVALDLVGCAPLAAVAARDATSSRSRPHLLQHRGVAGDVEDRVRVRRIVAEPGELQVDQAEHHLRRR